MSAMYMNGDNNNGHTGSYQANGSYHGGSSTIGANGFQGSQSSNIGSNGYQGRNGFIGSNQRPFQNRGSFNRGLKPYFGNKNKGLNGGFSDQGSSSQSGFNGQSSNGGSKNGLSWQSWNGNTNFKSSISPECLICSRRGHTAPNCHFRSTNNVSQYHILVCQICGKKRHNALECFYRKNYAYQGAPSPSTIIAMSAQG
ncbi:hypothetical protein ACFX2G_014768 [Malus domestica]